MNYFWVPWLLHHRCNFQACWSKKIKTLAATALDVWAGYGMVANPRKAEPLAYLACTQIQYSLHKHRHSTAKCALHILLLHKHRYKYEYIQAKATLCQGHGKDMLQFIKEKDTNTRKKYTNTEHLLWLIWLIVLWTFCERWWQQKEKERDTAPALEDPLGLLDKAETCISLILLQYFSDAATLFVWFCNVYFSDSLCPISLFLPLRHEDEDDCSAPLPFYPRNTNRISKDTSPLSYDACRLSNSASLLPCNFYFYLMHPANCWHPTKWGIHQFKAGKCLQMFEKRGNSSTLPCRFPRFGDQYRGWCPFNGIFLWLPFFNSSLTRWKICCL